MEDNSFNLNINKDMYNSYNHIDNSIINNTINNSMIMKIDDLHLIKYLGKNSLTDFYLAHMEENNKLFFTKKIKRKYMDEDIKINGLRIKKGLKELLSFLKSKNIKIAIASSSEIDYVKEKLKEANIDENIFDSIIGGDMVKIPKPDPYIYAKSCEILNVLPEYTLALEDSDYGIESAYKAGLKPILVPDIKEPKKETYNMAYKKCNNLLEVIDLFEED